MRDDAAHIIARILAYAAEAKPIMAEACEHIGTLLDQGQVLACVPYSRGPGAALWSQWQNRCPIIGFYLLVNEGAAVYVGNLARQTWQARHVIALTGDDAGRFLGWHVPGLSVIQIGWEDS